VIESVPSDGGTNVPEALIENENGNSEPDSDSVGEDVPEQTDSVDTGLTEEDSQRGNVQQDSSYAVPDMAESTEPQDGSPLESDDSDTPGGAESSTRESESDDVGVKGEAEQYRTKQVELLEQRTLLLQQQRAQHRQQQRHEQQDTRESEDHETDRLVQPRESEGEEGQATTDDLLRAGETQQSSGEGADVGRDANYETRDDQSGDSPVAGKVKDDVYQKGLELVTKINPQRLVQPRESEGEEGQATTDDLLRAGETQQSSGEGADVGRDANYETRDDQSGDSPVAGKVKDDVYQKGLELVTKINPQSKAEGYVLLMEAAESGHTKALEQVAYAHLIGSVLERNFTWSFEKFSQLADRGDPIGQQGLGFMYSTGIGVNSSQAKALLYYTFAALGGHYFAQMAMGYRSLMGISVAQSCETALYYYQKAAKKVADEVTLITGGLLISKARLMEEDNEATNVYGVSEDDMIHYHNVFADSGNTGAQVLLGVYYMFGMAGAERNFEMALKFLVGAASEGFAAANALIGKIYAEGSPEVPSDYRAAMEYFKRGRDLGHADGFSGMGMLYFYGMGMEQDYATALDYFQKAADKGSAEAQYFLGHMFYEGVGTKRNLNKALRYFQLASHGGHILAIYHLGEMHTDGRAVKRNCNYAVELFKGVAERGKWTRVLEDAERSYMVGDLDSALMVYLLLAEMGVEVAQTNAAYILEQGPT
jgi:TPR repeat protein